MKKILFSFMALTVAAMTFTACEDVPAPYNVFDEGEDNPSEIEPAGSGTAADPFNVAAAIEKCKEVGNTESTEKFYIKGKVAETTPSDDSYGNATFDLVDYEGGDAFKCFQVAGTDGKKLPNGFVFNKGDEVVVYGAIYNYNGKTPETVGKGAAYVVSVNGQSTEGGNTPPAGEAKGTGTEADPFNVAGAIAKCQAIGQTASSEKYYVTGIAQSEATADATYGNVTFDIADSEGGAKFKCYQVAGSNGEKLPAGFSIKKGDVVVVYGPIYNFSGNTPETAGKSAAYIVTVNGKATNDNSGSGDNDGATAVTVAQFNAAAESTEVWYKLTGTIKNLKDGDQYGNFDLEDETGSVYVYGLLSEKGGAKKKFQELVEKYGLANGSTITIIGNRGSYNGKIEVMNAYIVVEGNGGETGADGSTIISVADFNAAAESTDVWYQLTGTIKNLKDGDQYGNFDLEDETGSVYVYGVLSEKGGAKKKFQELVAAKGIANGKKITIVGNRGSYNGKIEVTNAYFIKVE